MENAKILIASDDNFDELINWDIPVLVDFWASWCAPCRAVAPILDDLANEYDGKVQICKLNVDDNEETPARYGVKGIPTFIFFQNGQMKDKIVGATFKSGFVSFIQKNLDNE